MTRTVGLVVPAYRPDDDVLVAYVDALRTAVEPDAIRVELDDPVRPVDALRDRLDAEVAVADRRRGKGMAITAGFEALETDVLAFVDADGSTDPTSVAHVVAPVERGSADAVVATRHHRESRITAAPSTGRQLMSRGFVLLARLVTGIRLGDFQCGAKAIDRTCWEAVKGDLSEPGFGWDLELLWLAHRRGYRLVEVPVTWTDRPGSTVAPMRTAVVLATLLVRLSVARLSSRDRVRPGHPRLLDQDGG